MANLRKWSQTATGNASVAGGANTINFAEGQTPGSVNNSAREMMAQVRKVYVPSEWGWVEHSATASVASQTTFKISGNQTTDWTAGRRWRLKSGSTTRYGSIVSSSFTVETTITVTVDSGSLSASHSLAALAAIDSNHIPANTYVTSSSLTTALGSYLTSNSASTTYAKLAGGNSFSGTQTINGLLSVTDATNGANLSASQGSLELFRSDSSAFIDFKTTSAEDYDCRIQQSSNGLTFWTGGDTTAANRLTITSAGVTNVLGAMSISGSVAIVGTLTVGGTSITGSGHTLLGTITTTSGASQTLSSLTLTNYKFLKLFFNGVSISLAGSITLGSATVTGSLGAANNVYGPVEVDLSNGAAGALVGGVGGATGYSTATTSITVAASTGVFDAGSILVYGVV